LAHSTRYIAKAWKWPESTVRLFLKRLKSCALIYAETCAGITVITIRNYGTSQIEQTESCAADGAASCAKPAHSLRRKEEGKKVIKKDAAKAALPLSEEVSPKGEEADLFRRGEQILGPQSGGLIQKLLKAKERNIPLARAAVEVAATKHDPRGYIGGCIRGADPDRYVDPRL
jgi:hypothetical protein